MSKMAPSQLRLSTVMRRRFSPIFYGVLAIAIFGLLIGLRVPVHFLLLASAAAAFLWLVRKFIRDNAAFARDVGISRFLSAAWRSALVFLVAIVFLLPGIWMGKFVTDLTNQGIAALQAWSAPTPSVLQVTTRVPRNVSDIPWWVTPAIYIGVFTDFAKQAATELFTQTTTILTPKPLPIRITAEALKVLLLAIGIYSTAWILILSSRTYAFLFGRVLVATPPPIEFGGQSHPYPNSAEFADRLKSGARLEIRLAPDERLYVRSSALPTNAIPDLRWAFRHGGFWPRLRHGLLGGNLVTARAGEVDYTFLARPGDHFIDIILADGDEVTVKPDHLIAFGDSARFRTEWNFSLPRLALHSATTFVASGPGRIILKCPGEPAAYRTAHAVPAVGFDRFMAFGKDSRFAIYASEGLQNYYASGCVVKPVTGRFFIIAPGVQQPSSGIAMCWQLMKQIYLPI